MRIHLAERRRRPADHVIRFARSCPCERCRRFVSRYDETCQEHRRRRCPLCLAEKWTLAEIAWVCRYILGPAWVRFVRLPASIARWAIFCPCSRCSGWRARLLRVAA